mgnify:CR=1 FL=1
MPTLQRDGFTSYYEDSGSGDALILICGLSADLQVWKFLVPELSKHARVVSLDNRGTGRSSAPDEPYTILQMADDVVALMDHLQIPAANILGWSMGGIIAQSLAVRHPERVKHLVLLGSFVVADGMLKNTITNWVNVRRSNMPYEQVARQVARWLYSPDLANDEVRYEGYIEAMVKNPYRQSVQGFIRQAEALVGYTAPAGLSDLRVPISIMVGEQDQLAPPYLSKQLHATFPHSTLHVLPGAHSGFVEHPAQYAETLIALLSGRNPNDA